MPVIRYVSNHAILIHIYSSPMKMHHSTVALSCGLSKAVKIVLFILTNKTWVSARDFGTFAPAGREGSGEST